MRDTRGKPTDNRFLMGDKDLAERLAAALAAEEREQDRVTHGFHTYPAGLHPEAAAQIIAAFHSGSVLDPFCGGGTVLVEARLAGRKALGFDISPVALRVARARTRTPDDATLTRFRSASRKLTAAARESDDLPPDDILRVVEPWYAPCAIHELTSLRRGIAEAPEDIRSLLEVTLSSILVKVSWRKSDTSAQKVTHRRPAGTTAVLFHKKARELARRMVALREAVPEGTPPAIIRPGDARKLTGPKTSLIVTSPPYPSTYDYLPMQLLRNVWLGDANHSNQEIGPRRAWRKPGAVKLWRRATLRWMASAANALRPGGKLVVVIGDGRTPTGTVDTSEATEEGGHQAGLKSVARASLERPDHARGTTRWEHIFVFAKTR